MDKNKVLRYIALGFFVTGALLIISSSINITGYAVGTYQNQWDIKLILGLGFVFGSLLMLAMQSRSQPSKKSIKIKISKKAVGQIKEKLPTRPRIREYLEEIRMIAANPLQRRHETAGRFNISPSYKIKIGIIVAWHYDKKTDTLFVDDLLYREKEDKCEWEKKAAKGKIMQEDYMKKGYLPFDKDSAILAQEQKADYTKKKK